MICPHCAFPNEDDVAICIKCKRPVAEPAEDGPPPAPGPTLTQLADPHDDSFSSPPVEAAHKRLDEADRLEREGDLRGAFLCCQSILIDHFPHLSPDEQAGVYLAMGRISIQQDKRERALKYLQQAQKLVPDLPGLADLNAAAGEEAKTVDAEPNTKASPSHSPEDRDSPGRAAQVAAPLGSTSVQGRLAFAAPFWLRSLALGLDGLLVVLLLSGMVALASAILNLDGDAVIQILAGGLTNLFVVFFLLVFLLLTYLTIFARIGGQTLGKMLLGLRVVRLDGHSLTTWGALRRALGMLLAGLPGLAGFLWAAFDLNRRGWHDRVAGTLVVRIRPPEAAEEQKPVGELQSEGI